MYKAAHFLQTPELIGSPPNEAILAAYRELGVEVDIYAPRCSHDPDHVDEYEFFFYEQGMRWLLRNSIAPKWHSYIAISGTCEDAIAPVGLFGFLYRRPIFTLADEIRSGSYSGNKAAFWKKLCRWSMRKSAFTIVNDASRVSLQRSYAHYSKEAEFLVYPGCFQDPPMGEERLAVREELGIPPHALTVAYSGTLNLGNGGLWVANLLGERADVHILGQITGADPLVRGLLKCVQGANRLHVEPTRLSWRKAWSRIVAADIGTVVYLQDGPQFQNMGISSNRLCMFLAMGVPVIASRQPSFRFIEEYDCGILVGSETEFIAAIDQISGRLDEMKANALRCAREYIDAPGKYLVLRDAIARLLGKDRKPPQL